MLLLVSPHVVVSSSVKALWCCTCAALAVLNQSSLHFPVLKSSLRILSVFSTLTCCSNHRCIEPSNSVVFYLDHLVKMLYSWEYAC